MLSVRVTAPGDISATVQTSLAGDPCVCDLAVMPGAALGGAGDLLFFDVAREGVDTVMEDLRLAGVPERGSIVVTEPMTVVAEAARAAEDAAQGHPADGVLWAQLADKSREDARPSVNFFVFLLLATLIAGVGRLLDQPILIIGAMVVGPEFAPISSLCYAIVRRKGRLAGWSLTTLFGGFAGCMVIAWALWAALYHLGVTTYDQATTGPATQFIVSPDAWSFVIAVLAGIAGVLSLTSEKSSALVGVFISITTVPAVGTAALTLAVGAWSQALSAGVQLLVNVAGLVIAGAATLFVQMQIAPRLRRTAR